MCTLVCMSIGVSARVYVEVCKWVESRQGLSNTGNVDESHRSWECVCMRAWRVFVKTHGLVYFWWSRGPRHHQKTETLPRHCIHILLEEAVVPAPPLRTHTSLNASHHLFDQGGQPSPWTCHLTAAFDTEHRMQFNNKTKTKINANQGLSAILPHNKNFSHLPPITSSHRFIQTSKDVSETAEITIKRTIYHDTHIHIRYVYMCTHIHTNALPIWAFGGVVHGSSALKVSWHFLLPPAHLLIFGCNQELKQQSDCLSYHCLHHHLPRILWASYLSFDTISARVWNSYEGRSNEKGSVLLYCLGPPVFKEYNEGNLVLEIKINHTHHLTDDPE